MEENRKIIILTAPSGAGKTTIKTKLLAEIPELMSFSVSATTRKIRAGEKDGVDYVFLNEDEFKQKIEHQEFIEWEMVYPGLYYGTTLDEMKRIWRDGKTPLLDIDVKGALNVKKQFGENVLTIFIDPPSIEILRERLTNRGTDSDEHIQTRINKATEEIGYKKNFDTIILNDDLKKATEDTLSAVLNFISKG
jgi:guanylate kinase